jgi:hypothetical protein
MKTLPVLLLDVENKQHSNSSFPKGARNIRRCPPFGRAERPRPPGRPAKCVDLQPGPRVDIDSF